MTDVSVFKAIASVMDEMEGIGKNQLNKDQGYRFRGIDDVLKELHPLLAKHGVIFAPDVVERVYEERISQKGTVGHVAHLHITYKIYGPSGDFIEVSTWGEGLDYSDKETNKAMTAAFKYALFQVFAIADPEDDGDTVTHDGGSTQHQFKGPQSTRSDKPFIAENEDIQMILDAADKSGDEFLTSLAKQFRERGTLTDKQLNAGIAKAAKIVTSPRSAPQSDAPWPEEEQF